MAFDRSTFPEVPMACQFHATLDRCLPFAVEGRVRSMERNRAVCVGFPVSEGSVCELQNAKQAVKELEVDSTRDGTTVIRCDSSDEIQIETRVRLKRTVPTFPVGDYVLGRVLDASGKCLDGADCLDGANRNSLRPRVPVERTFTTGMERPPIENLLRTKIIPIDKFPPVGQGQRVLIACSSSTPHAWVVHQLLASPAADVKVLSQTSMSDADWSSFMNEWKMQKHRSDWTAIVASPTSPISEIRRAMLSAVATSEYFRDGGKDVLLVIDLFGVASSQSLAVGDSNNEPDWDVLLKQLCGRIGRNRRGSITGVILMNDRDVPHFRPRELDDPFDCQIWLECAGSAEEFTCSIDRSRSKNRLPLKLAMSLFERDASGKQPRNDLEFKG